MQTRDVGGLNGSNCSMRPGVTCLISAGPTISHFAVCAPAPYPIARRSKLDALAAT
jgi:hypothetical protein